ncbi:CKLF-like MARVEL transmembrane domain-containing protein 4 [Thrips palmi]|uniref:CKLF-like MARVEL transmembrane domain-containing protein 4 n=1 Tax=Thrips palmi TaxID=161013 RepID=A0A6P8YTG2_THRPL|nr:CKLF-like MARVEL transmembrane domain-containing protein 4 [Thrips palmi]
MMTETAVTVTTSHPQHAQQHPTVKTDPGQSPGNLSWMRININYFKTVPGILKLVQAVLGILCMALASPAYLSGTHWFLFVVVSAFIATLIWIFVYLLGIREALRLPINWILTELINTGIMTILYFIAFIVQLAAWSPWYGYARGSNIAAGVFGIFNFIAYAAGAYSLYLEWKGSPVTVNQ